MRIPGINGKLQGARRTQPKGAGTESEHSEQSGKLGTGGSQTSAFGHPAAGDVSPCRCPPSGPACGRPVHRPLPLSALGSRLLPRQACRGAALPSHTKTKTAERPFLERPASSERDAVGSRLPLSPRRDARSPIATAAFRNWGCAGALCAGAERGGHATSARVRRPSRDGVMGRGLGRREEAAGEWRWRRVTMAWASAGPRILPRAPARPPGALATTSCRGEGSGHK